MPERPEGNDGAGELEEESLAREDDFEGGKEMSDNPYAFTPKLRERIQKALRAGADRHRFNEREKKAIRYAVFMLEHEGQVARDNNLKALARNCERTAGVLLEMIGEL